MNPLEQPNTASSVYPRLRRIARFRLRCGRDALLDTTALVHESYIRFAQSNGMCAADWQSFLRYAPRIMRNVGRFRPSPLRSGRMAAGPFMSIWKTACALPRFNSKGKKEIIALRRAMEQLELVDPRLAQVVEMRFFEGIAESEIARALGVTERTVRRDWEKARLLLALALRPR